MSLRHLSIIHHGFFAGAFLASVFFGMTLVYLQKSGEQAGYVKAISHLSLEQITNMDIRGLEV